MLSCIFIRLSTKEPEEPLKPAILRSFNKKILNFMNTKG